MELKRVVVTGIGCISPLGNSAEDTWKNLLAGVSGCDIIKQMDASRYKTQIACEVKDFNPEQWIDRKDARKMDKFCQMAVAGADMAIKDSGMDLEKINKDRVGVIYGVGIGGLKTMQEELEYYSEHKDTPKFGPFFIPKMIGDIAPGHISIRYGFHGPNYATTSACASSTNALADAFNLLRLGKAEVIVAGGSEAVITDPGLGGFCSMHALSSRNDEPQKASRPFSASRDGFVMGEGSACLILEEQIGRAHV